MVRPQEVKAPKEKIEVLAILEDGTKTRKGYSVALVKWYAKKAIAIRWEWVRCTGQRIPSNSKWVPSCMVRFTR